MIDNNRLTNGKRTIRPVNIERSKNIKKLVDLKGLVDVKKPIIIYYKY